MGASKGHGRNILLILCVRVAVCHVSKDHGRNILLILCVSVVVWWCVMLQMDMVEIFFLFHVSVWQCGGVSCFKRTWYEYSSYSVCQCGGVVVCPASNGHGRTILLIPCVRVAVWWCVRLQKDMIEIFFLFGVAGWGCVM